MFVTYRKDERTDQEKYLESELERERYERQEQQERDERQRTARAKEDREEREYNYRHPDTWPQAFRVNADLCRREVDEFDTGDFFKKSAEANEAALKIWQEVYAEKQKLIEEIQDSIRETVAERLVAANPSREYSIVAGAILNDELDNYCDW